MFVNLTMANSSQNIVFSQPFIHSLVLHVMMLYVPLTTQNVLFKCSVHNVLFKCSAHNVLFKCSAHNVLFKCSAHNDIKKIFQVCKSMHHLYNSNKSPTRCNNFSSLFSTHLFTAQHVSGVPTPIIRSSTTAVAASGFTFGVW